MWHVRQETHSAHRWLRDAVRRSVDGATVQE